MTPKNIYIGENILRKNAGSASGEIVIIDKEKYYKISGYDNMPPFLMNIVSDSDLWMFISSSGALTAGRQNPDNALFPYYTDDRIHDSHEITGSKTILFAAKDNKNFLWQPFSETCSAIYSTERNIYKNFTGSKLIFEEINFDLSLSFSYSWSSCEQFGFIKKAKITNNGGENISINILDGIQNILPYGTDRKFQLEFSTLLDGYKKNELLDETGLALFTLSSVPTDKAEPSEALRATIAWSTGLSNSAILLSSRQLELFKKGNQVCRERNVRGVRGAYFLNSEFVLPGESSTEWYIAADVSKNHSDIAEISSMLSSNKNLKQEIEYEIGKDSAGLISKAAGSDGLQLTNDPLISSRHLSNVMFNIMRGGIPDDNYKINKKDFDKFILNSNYQLHEKYSAFIGTLPDRTGSSDLQEKIDTLNDADFLRLYYEYLPLTFSRRHGDPSRPWNLFSINIKDENGNKVLNYQGNWRDIFQNWEALALSFPDKTGK